MINKQEDWLDDRAFWPGRKILVTGGAGFIGSHLVAALTGRGAQVTVLDDFSTGREQNLNGLPVRLIRGDVADWETVLTAVQGCELIFHQAALVSVPQSIAEPQLNQRSNVTGTFHVLEAARQQGVRRVIYASSAAVYGDSPELPKRETDPAQPLTPYALAKYVGEQTAVLYQQLYGLETVGLRYMNVFGPRQNPASPYSGVISLFCQAALQGQPCRVHGDGEQTRDFIYVEDVIRANLQAAVRPYAALAARPIFNVGSGRQTSLNEMLRLLGEIVGVEMTAVHGPPRQGDIRHSLADITQAQAGLDFQAQTSFAAGLRATVDWYSQQGMV